MNFTLPAKLLGIINPAFLNDTECVYKKLIYIQKESLKFIRKDFWDSMTWKQVKGKSHKHFLEKIEFSIIEEKYHTFCSAVEASSVTDYSQPPQETNIPPVIHFIWLGSRLPLDGELSIQSWKTHHPEWEIKVWGDSEAKTFEWTDKRSKRNFELAPTYAEKSDILRYEILYQYGGVYSDTDVICMKPFHDLMTQGIDFFAGLQVNSHPFHVATCIIGSIKKSKILEYCIQHHLGITEAPDMHIFNRTGPSLFTKGCVNNLNSLNEKLLFLPTSYFYPFPSINRNLPLDRVQECIRDETMAVHLWNASWTK